MTLFQSIKHWYARRGAYWQHHWVVSGTPGETPKKHSNYWTYTTKDDRYAARLNSDGSYHLYLGSFVNGVENGQDPLMRGDGCQHCIEAAQKRVAALYWVRVQQQPLSSSSS